jgi:CheY-specific phosphatase CheX
METMQTLLIPLLETVPHTFNTLTNTPVDVLGDFPQSYKKILPFDVAAVVTFQGLGARGTLALCMSKTVYLAVLNRMLATEYPEIDEENCDGVAELLNVIYATSRTHWNKAGMGFDLALPIVIRGQSPVIGLPKGGDARELRCNCEFGDFSLLIHLEETLMRTR